MACCSAPKWQLCWLLLCGSLGLLMLVQANSAGSINGFHSVEAALEAYKHTALEPLVGVAREIWATIGPGGRWHPAWFLEHKGHLVIEGMLMVLILGMLLQHRFRPKEQEEEDGLTEKVRTATQQGSPWHQPLPAAGSLLGAAHAVSSGSQRASATSPCTQQGICRPGQVKTVLKQQLQPLPTCTPTHVDLPCLPAHRLP
jgi:hypothetical protein